MKLPKVSIENHQFTIVIVILLMLSGIISMVRMPKSEDPPVAKPGSSVIVVYPGATPEDLEQLVAIPIEEALNELDDIKKLESTCQDGLANIGIEFYAGCDPDEKFSDVNEKVNRIRGDLPEDILRVETMRWSVSDTNFLQIALISDEMEYRDLEQQAENLEKALKKIIGVKRVETWAYPKQEIRVSLDLEKMAQLNIPVNNVLGAIKSSNMNIPGGTIDAGFKRFSVQTSGAYKSILQLKNTIIHSDGKKVLYLKDIASVSYSYEDNNYFARYNGKRAVFVTVNQKEHTNIFDIMKQIRLRVEEFEDHLPQEMELAYVYNQSESVHQRLSSFFSSLLQGIFLVGIVILLTIGFRGSIIVIMAIPLSLTIAIGFVDKSGFGLEQMSIAGLVITLGLLVDNAIVVVENINRFIGKGETRINAAIKGSSQIGWAIVSATATTVLAFVPIASMKDVSGEFIRSMPITVIFTLTVSLVLALTFTPYISIKVLSASDKQRTSKAMTWMHRFIQTHYSRWLDFALGKPGLIILLAVLFLIGSLALLPFIGVSFFPKAEKNQFFINIHLPEGSSISGTDQVVSYVENRLKSRSEVEQYTSNIGRSNPRIYYNIIEKRRKSNRAQIFVKLKEQTSRKKMGALVSELRDDFNNFPGAIIEVKELEQGPPLEAPVEIKVVGDNLDILKKVALDVEDIFKKIPGLININNPLGTSKTDIRVNINREKAAMYGIPLMDLDRTIRMSIAGITISKFLDKEGKEYNIVVRSNQKENRMDVFDRIYVSSYNGMLIPLKQVASIQLKKSSSMITHYNLERNVTIRSDVKSGYSVSRLTQSIVDKLNTYRWPVGYRFFVGGEQESQERSFGGMAEAMVIAIVAIFAVLVLQFKSFVQPLIVYAALPLAIIGSVITLLITGYTFSFTAFVGLTSLVGIVVNNSIILVDYTNQLRKGGLELLVAIKEAGKTRFVPIILTTLTTIGGLLPLTLRGGTLWAPMGWTIIGGLLTSTILTLIVVPVLYKIFEQKR
jgi:multidrug efflux pump subunit AcrB